MSYWCIELQGRRGKHIHVCTGLSHNIHKYLVPCKDKFAYPLLLYASSFMMFIQQQWYLYNMRFVHIIKPKYCACIEHAELWTLRKALNISMSYLSHAFSLHVYCVGAVWCAMLVYCNCMTTVQCWSLMCCMSSCNLIDYSVYKRVQQNKKRLTFVRIERKGTYHHPHLASWLATCI